MDFVLGVMRRRHADAIGDVPTIQPYEFGTSAAPPARRSRLRRIRLVLLGLEAVDISVVQHAGMLHVLVQFGCVVVVLGVVRRRHADALSDMHAIGWSERIGLVLL